MMAMMYVDLSTLSSGIYLVGKRYVEGVGRGKRWDISRDIVTHFLNYLPRSSGASTRLIDSV
jgi:hypothetical protein